MVLVTDVLNLKNRIIGWSAYAVPSQGYAKVYLCCCFESLDYAAQHTVDGHHRAHYLRVARDYFRLTRLTVEEARARG